MGKEQSIRRMGWVGGAHASGGWAEHTHIGRHEQTAEAFLYMIKTISRIAPAARLAHEIYHAVRDRATPMSPDKDVRDQMAEGGGMH